MSAYQIEDAEEGGFYVSKFNAVGVAPIVFAASSIDEALLYIRKQMVVDVGDSGVGPGGAKIKYR